MFADGCSRSSPADPAVARLSAYPVRIRMESPRVVVQRQTLFRSPRVMNVTIKLLANSRPHPYRISRWGSTCHQRHTIFGIVQADHQREHSLSLRP